MSKTLEEIFQDLKVPSEEIVDKLGLSLKDLWLVKFQGKTFGPYLHEQLDDLTHDYSDELSVLEICNIEEENWDTFFNHNCFERREKKLYEAKDEEEEGEKLLVLKDGNKLGPFTIKEIQEKIQEGVVHITDDATADWGQTWFKLYQHAQFDRRTHDELPKTPTKDQFEHSKMEVIATEQIRQKNDQEDLLVGLAYSQHTDKYRDNESSFKSILQPVASNKAAKKKMFVMGMAAMLAVFFMFSNKVDKNKGDTKTNKTITSKYSASKKTVKRRPSSTTKKETKVKKVTKTKPKTVVKKRKTRKKKRTRRLPSRTQRRAAQRKKYKRRKRKVKTYKKFHGSSKKSDNEEKSYDNEYTNDGSDDFAEMDQPKSKKRKVRKRSNAGTSEDSYNDSYDNEQNYE